MAHTTSGHLLIADISGYTRYLTSSELEHAQQVLGSLMELLVDRTLPPLRVAGLQGDAVFSYGLASRALGGQTLVEMIETTYVAFRRAIEQMVLNTTCRCNACASSSSLDQPRASQPARLMRVMRACESRATSMVLATSR